MQVDYTGILNGAYYVKHRVTGERRIVALGARYNQHEWDILGPVPTEEDWGVY